jgi:chromosome partitioning protein
MRTIALMNQKGGVGKTTTTVNLGAALAERGRRVLLIDLDPQAHLTITYGVEPADGPTLYEVLAGDVGVLQATRRLEVPGIAEKGGEIHVLPGSLDLAGLESEMANVDNRQLQLRAAMERAGHDYDYVLLDCPPSLGLLTVNALALADEVLIPMQAHFLALQGFAKLLETTQLVGQSINQGLKVGGVVLTMFDAQTRLGSDVVNELQGFFDAARGQKLPWSESRLYDTKVRRNIKLAEAPSFGQSILAYDPASNGAADYRALAAELEADLNRAETEALKEPGLEAEVFRRSTAGLKAKPVAAASPAESAV